MLGEVVAVDFIRTVIVVGRAVRGDDFDVEVDGVAGIELGDAGRRRKQQVEVGAAVGMNLVDRCGDGWVGISLPVDDGLV